MSEFLIKKPANGKEKGNGVIRGVTFCYAKMQEGDFKYGSTTEREFVVDCIVDKTTAKSWKKSFAKNTYTEVETEDFASRYKIHPPTETEGEDEQFVIKVKAKAQLSGAVQGMSKGDPIPYDWSSRPKVFVPVEDSDDVDDITMSTLVANGSQGSVAFDIVENDYGTFPQLTGLLVTDLIEYLIEYQAQSSGSPFGHINKTHEGDGKTHQKAVAEDNREPPSEDEDPNPF